MFCRDSSYGDNLKNYQSNFYLLKINKSMFCLRPKGEAEVAKSSSVRDCSPSPSFLTTTEDGEGETERLSHSVMSSILQTGETAMFEDEAILFFALVTSVRASAPSLHRRQRSDAIAHLTGSFELHFFGADSICSEI